MQVQLPRFTLSQPVEWDRSVPCSLPEDAFGSSIVAPWVQNSSKSSEFVRRFLHHLHPSYQFSLAAFKIKNIFLKSKSSPRGIVLEIKWLLRMVSSHICNGKPCPAYIFVFTKSLLCQIKTNSAEKKYVSFKCKNAGYSAAWMSNLA